MHITKEALHHFFDICPFAGIFCVECGVPIQWESSNVFRRASIDHDCYKSKSNGIVRHPNRAKELIPDDRHKTYDYCMVTCKRLVTMMLTCSIEHIEVELEKYLADPNNYKACADCKGALVENVAKHIGSHRKNCTGSHPGRCVLGWVRKNAKVVPSPLDVCLLSNYDTTFLRILREAFANMQPAEIAASPSPLMAALSAPAQQPDMPIPAANAPVPPQSTDKSEFLRGLFAEQDVAIEAATDNTIQLYDQSEQPNLWLHKVGWDLHLNGLDAPTLHALTVPRDNDSAALIAVLQSVDRVLRHASQVSEAFAPSNNIHYVLEQKRVDGDGSKKAFQPHVEPQTLERYIGIMAKIVRVIFGMKSLPATSRPPCKMATNITAIMDWLLAVPVETTREAVDAKTTEFLFSLFSQPIESDTYDLVLVSALAVCAITDDGGFAAPKDYTLIYAAIIKCIRWLILAASKSEADSNATAAAATAAAANPVAAVVAPVVAAVDGLDSKSFFELVEEKMESFMLSPKFAMDWIYNMTAYGKSIALQTAPENNIYWSDDTITYRDIRLSMDQLRVCVHSTVRLAKSKLLELLQMDSDLDAEVPADIPAIPWNTQWEDCAELKVDYSFLTDARNPWVRKHRRFILQRILGSVALQDKWIESTGATDGAGVDADSNDDDGDGQPNSNNHSFLKATVTDFEKLLSSFQELLLVLVHMTGGQPARSTEIINIRYKNTRNGGQRNIFAEDGLVCILTTYHKTLLQTNMAKLIYRYLPREVGELLVWYLTLVAPFWRVVQSRATGHTKPNPYLFTADFVVDTLAKPTFWDSERLSSVLQRVFNRFTGVTKMNVSSWRQICVAICNRYLKEFDAAGEREDDYAQQTGHTVFTEGINYARLLGQMRIGIPAQRERFRAKSVYWHLFLDFTPMDTSSKRKANEMTGYFTQQRAQRLSDLMKTTDREMLDTLKRMYNLLAEFRGNQLAVLRQIVTQPTSSVLQIASTGAGKTLSFMLPYKLCPWGTTVVIVPLLQLQLDLLKRCAAAGIEAAMWKSNVVSDPTARLILVTTESFVSNRFTAFLNRLTSKEMLDRIVVDECHTFLDCGEAFRPDMARVGAAVQSWRVQSVFLTATMPPVNFKDFLKWTNIERQDLHVFRGITTRPNIQYSVEKVSSNAIRLNKVTSLVELYKDRYAAQNGLIIVYARTIQDGNRLAEKLHCSLYHSKCHADDKETMYAEWVSRGPVIVATSALGAGIDIPNICAVIHAGMPDNLRSFVQESGRAGRGGQLCTSVVLAGCEYPPISP